MKKGKEIHPLSHANIIEILGIQNIPLEKRTAIVDAVADLVDARVRNRILETLSEGARERFIALAGGDDEDALAEFFDERDIDIFALAEEEVEKAKEELVTFTQKAQEEL